MLAVLVIVLVLCGGGFALVLVASFKRTPRQRSDEQPYASERGIW